MDTCEMGIEILQKTKDGNDLDPIHLKLVEMAVNGFLNENGMDAFRCLHEEVMKGYRKPWFHGIEHLSLDHDGYVYWKGRKVEHYDFPFAYSGEGKESASELAERCKRLEGLGVEVNVTNVIWKWEEFEKKSLGL